MDKNSLAHTKENINIMKQMISLLLAVLVCCALLWGCGIKPENTEPAGQLETTTIQATTEVHETTEMEITEEKIILDTEPESAAETEVEETEPEIESTAVQEDPKPTKTDAPEEKANTGDHDLPLG